MAPFVRSCRRLFTTVLVTLFLLAPAALRAQEPVEPSSDAELRALVAGAGPLDGPGGADVVTVFHRTRVEVEASGLAHVRDHSLLKCLSEAGASRLGALRFDYDPSSNEVRILGARILRRDGDVLTLRGDDALDLPQPQHAIYWGARMKVLAVPRMDVGDALEVVTETRGFQIAYLGEPEDEEARFVPPLRGHFHDVVRFDEAQPAVLRLYQIVLPQDKRLQFEVYNGEVESNQTWDGSNTTYSFWKRTTSPLPGRASSPNPSDLQTKVVLSTLPDWQEKSRWFHVVNVAQFEADEPMRELAAALTKGRRGDDERIAAIVHWAANEIRYSGISMGHGEGYTLHPASMVFHDRSGVCKDKAGMAITLLRAAGYEVYPAMTMAGARVERIPADQFNHCVGALRKSNGEWLLVDPTWVVNSPEIWSSAEGEQHYVIGTPEGERLAKSPSARAEDNALIVHSEASIDEEGTLKGVLTLSGRGSMDQRLRRELKESRATMDRQEFFERIVADIGPNAMVEPVAVPETALADFSRPLRLVIRYSIADYALVGRGVIHVVPPLLKHPLRDSRFAPYFDASAPATTDRPVFLWLPRERLFTEKLILPKGYSPRWLPPDQSVDGSAASLETRVRARGRVVESHVRLIIKKRTIPTDEYANFRSAVQPLLSRSTEYVVFEAR